MTPSVRSSALMLLSQEAQALLTRLDRVRPFALHETMVPAAAPPLAAQVAIERFLVNGRREMRRLIAEFLGWLRSPPGRRAPVVKAQRRFAFLRLRFNDVLSQFDIFSEVITQRSEHETGVWLAGLDVLAADALAMQGDYFTPPPLVCYLDRGHGAAIRRARTRLPGGGENPIAIIRVPRERMVGNGIASSLVHEVGHQGAALLNLVDSLRGPLRKYPPSTNGHMPVWTLFHRWISEILADLWSVSRIGIGSTLGLMGVVSLPRAFVFRVGLDDPHPIPWIRVKISCAMGNALYPHPQWDKVAAMWESYYPLAGLDTLRRQLLANLEAAIPEFVSLVLSHRSDALRGKTLGEVLVLPDRSPERLRALYPIWMKTPQKMRRAAPSLVFAVFGQARSDGKLKPAEESRLLSELLSFWALRSQVDTSSLYAALRETRGVALAT